MEDQCSQAGDAKNYANSLAPAGTKIRLENPYAVDDTDKDGRLLRYVDLNEGDKADIGYSLLLSNLARARFDSRDGYQWHPREKAYRATKANPSQASVCHWEAALVLVADDDSGDEDEKLRRVLWKSLHARFKAVHLWSKAADAVKKTDRESDDLEREMNRYSNSGGGGRGGSFNVPGSLCPTRWC